MLVTWTLIGLLCVSSGECAPIVVPGFGTEAGCVAAAALTSAALDAEAPEGTRFFAVCDSAFAQDV
jgi:hypothetical protein